MPACCSGSAEVGSGIANKRCLHSSLSVCGRRDSRGLCVTSRHDAANRHNRDDRKGNKQQGNIDQVHGVSSIPRASCDASECGLNCDLDAGSKGGAGRKLWRMAARRGAQWLPLICRTSARSAGSSRQTLQQFAAAEQKNQCAAKVLNPLATTKLAFSANPLKAQTALRLPSVL